MQARDHRRTLRHLAFASCALVAPQIHADPVREPDPVHEPWYAGPAGRHRLHHLALVGAATAAYATTVLVLGPRIGTENCRWCEPPAFDQSVRDAVVWNNPNRAGLLSDIDTYALAPAVGIGLLIAVDYDAGWGRFLDDTLPVVASIAVSQTVSQLVKLSVGRERPDGSDNRSFYSGHSSLGWVITTSSGLICHWRHYWTEPYVWGAGIALSLSTEYLRMGADKHYLSDVLIGGAVGAATGLLVPRLMRQDIVIVPSNHGASVAWSF